MIEAYRLQFAPLEIRTARLRQTFREAEEAENKRTDGTLYVLERQYLLWIDVAGNQIESLRVAQKGKNCFEDADFQNKISKCGAAC